MRVRNMPPRSLQIRLPQLKLPYVKAFICYPSEHPDDAREVAGFLKAVGVDRWFDKDSIAAGEDWDRTRKVALADADLVVVLCASQTISRDGVYQREINEALELARDRRPGGVFIIPLRLEKVDLPPELSRLQYVDKWEPAWRRKLAAGLVHASEGLSEPAAEPLRVAAAEPDEGGVLQRELHLEDGAGQIDATWIQYEASGDYWDYVNGLITARALGASYSARRQFAERDRSGSSYLEYGVSEFNRKGDLVSLVIGSSSFYAGAAHPNNLIETLNVMGPRAGTLTVAELFGHSSEGLGFLAEYTAADLRRQHVGTGQQAPDAWFPDGDAAWRPFEQFGFNEAGMIINLSAASGLPHVFGVLDVYIPWHQAEPFLTPVAKRVVLDAF